MPFFVNTRKFFKGYVFSKRIPQANRVIQAENNDNVPVPNGNVQIKNDNIVDSSIIEGAGFMVKGAGQIKKNRNDKLRKFITLNI